MCVSVLCLDSSEYGRSKVTAVWIGGLAARWVGQVTTRTQTGGPQILHLTGRCGQVEPIFCRPVGSVQHCECGAASLLFFKEIICIDIPAL